MKRTYQVTGFVLLIVMVLVGAVLGVTAQTEVEPQSPQGAMHNTFSYQGYLADSGGNPINDICDFRFVLYDAATSGAMIGTYDDKFNMQVVDGYFTVELNDGNEFGSDSFMGDERYLSITVACDNGGPQTTLAPRQRLMAVPYAIYTLNIPDHNHYGETWEGTGFPYGLFINNTNAAGVGLIVRGPGGDTGRAISAVGGIYSTADSLMYLSPHDMVVRYDSTSTTLSPMAGGGTAVTLPQATTVKVVTIPVHAFGQLLGSQMYVKSLQVCYKGTNAIITTAAVAKNTGTTNGETYYILDNTDRTSGTYACYTVSATTPRVAIDNTTWVQFNVQNPTPSATSIMEIYTVKLTLTEVQN
ncbi:MAG: hypothetical protein IPM39_10820 [Chloroflexi bacterium]|nr:hypothetical protein [Chloroflexota bacterium]